MTAIEILCAPAFESASGAIRDSTHMLNNGYNVYLSNMH